jgi:hypothetical protein
MFKILYWMEVEGTFVALHKTCRTMRYELACEKWTTLKNMKHHNNFFGLPSELREWLCSVKKGSVLDFVFTGTEFFVLVEV